MNKEIIISVLEGMKLRNSIDTLDKGFKEEEEMFAYNQALQDVIDKLK